MFERRRGPNVRMESVALPGDFGTSIESAPGRDTRCFACEISALIRFEHVASLAGAMGLIQGMAAIEAALPEERAQFSDAINDQADVVMASYYPLMPAFTVRDPKVVHRDFDAICKKYPNRPISFVEATLHRQSLPKRACPCAHPHTSESVRFLSWAHRFVNHRGTRFRDVPPCGLSYRAA